MLLKTGPGRPPPEAPLLGSAPPPDQAFILKTAMSSLWHSSDASAARLLAASAHWRPCMDPADQPVLASRVSVTACIGNSRFRAWGLGFRVHVGQAMHALCAEPFSGLREQ